MRRQSPGRSRRRRRTDARRPDERDRDPRRGRDGLVAARPGLLLDDEVALDGKDAACVAEVEEIDEVRLDIELVAVLAQPARDAEAQPLASIRQPERRVEPGRDQAAGARWATLAEAGH